jgi:hypothetical protein
MPRVASIKGLFESIPTAIRGIRTGKMRSLSKLIPGVHPKLPGDSQKHVKGIFEHSEGHREELNLYITGEEEALAEATEPTPEERVEPEADLTPEGQVVPEPDEEGDR